jgi:predicted transcriptional regulator YheO
VTAVKVLTGKPLAAYEDIYPIRVNEAGALYLDKDRFEKALDVLASTPSPRAIADLIYLGKENHVSLMLTESGKNKFITMSELPDYASLSEANADKDNILQSYKDIVNGIGQTFAGTPIEIVLHDTRNPLKSIVAVQNPISGRRLGDSNTNFGIQLIKNYSNMNNRGGNASFVAYPLTLKDGRAIKSTTVPLFSETYGLVGFICLNVDISKMDMSDPKAVAAFIDAFKTVTSNDAITEMIQNSKRKS